MNYDPFSILPNVTPVITTESPVVFHADQTPAARTIPASITKQGHNGDNTLLIPGKLDAVLAKRREGRMSCFTEDNAATVVEALEDGATMEAAAAEIGVTRKTLWTWMQLLPEFGDAVARAREYQGHASADNAVRILDDVKVDNPDAKQNMVQLRKAEQRARIRMELAKAFNFRQYGDKKQSLNLNLTAAVSPVDLSKYS